MAKKPNFFIYNHIIVLQNYKFWQENVGELDQWLHANGGKREGMTVSGLTSNKQTLFALKWS